MRCSREILLTWIAALGSALLLAGEVGACTCVAPPPIHELEVSPAQPLVLGRLIYSEGLGTGERRETRRGLYLIVEKSWPEVGPSIWMESDFTSCGVSVLIGSRDLWQLALDKEGRWQVGSCSFRRKEEELAEALPRLPPPSFDMEWSQSATEEALADLLAGLESEKSECRGQQTLTIDPGQLAGGKKVSWSVDLGRRLEEWRIKVVEPRRLAFRSRNPDRCWLVASVKPSLPHGAFGSAVVAPFGGHQGFVLSVPGLEGTLVVRVERFRHAGSLEPPRRRGWILEP